MPCCVTPTSDGCFSAVDRTRIAVPAPARSYLFVPADRPERIAKARAAGADAVIVDLEDAVNPDTKTAARTMLARHLDAAQPVWIRVNGPDSEWFRDDVTLCRTPGVAGVVLPKAERVEQVRYLAEQIGDDVPVLALIETARGMWNAHAIAGSAWVERLGFGALDFQLDLGMADDDDALRHFRAQLVLVSRVADILPPVDGVTTALDDATVLRADAERARRLGFGAKLCIHPKQVATVNACFSPSSEEIAWARRIVQAAADTTHGAVAVDGKMVDRPILARAQAILRVAEEAEKQ